MGEATGLSCPMASTCAASTEPTGQSSAARSSDEPDSSPAATPKKGDPDEVNSLDSLDVEHGSPVMSRKGHTTSVRHQLFRKKSEDKENDELHGFNKERRPSKIETAIIDPVRGGAFQ